MTFEQQWDAARLNTWYWLSYAAMLALPVVGAVCVALIFARRPRVRRTWHFLLAFLCFLVTAGTTVQSIGLKWELRAQAAQTEQEKTRVAMRDTGNLAFAPIIGALCGMVAVVVWCAVALVAGRFAVRRLSTAGGPAVAVPRPRPSAADRR